MHYYCWYCGFEYSDDSIDFNRRLRAAGLSTNHDIAWSYDDHCYERIYDYSLMRPYLKAFEKVRK